jgi:hypothetical protein
MTTKTASPKLTEQQMMKLYLDGDFAGRKAAAARVPAPMTVVDTLSGHVYEPIADGVCGFAWVKLRPGNSSFARFLVKKGIARSSYSGGVDIWIREYGQSYEKKLAYAQGMAGVFEDAGFRAYAQGRLD